MIGTLEVLALIAEGAELEGLREAFAALRLVEENGWALPESVARIAADLRANSLRWGDNPA